MTKIQTSASGKIILFGEHAVVYGIPAIAIPISSRRAYATVYESTQPLSIVAEDLQKQDIAIHINVQSATDSLSQIVTSVLQHFNAEAPQVEIRITSDIPIASGLGSGAAISAAIGKAIAEVIGKQIPLEELNNLVFEVEKIHHGTPSGIDNTVIVYEQPIYFVKGQAIQFLDIQSPFHIVIADTGQTALTHEAVGDVRKLYEADPAKIKAIFEKIKIIVQHARQCIESGKIHQLGEIMTENHTYLKQLTVSSPKLDRLVDAAMQGGALGAKLSGGGRGGNMIALVDADTVENVKSALANAGAARVFDSIVQ